MDEIDTCIITNTASTLHLVENTVTSRYNEFCTDPENNSWLWREFIIQKEISFRRILYKNASVCFLDPPPIIRALVARWIAHKTLHKMTDNVINYSSRRPTENET